MKRDWVECTLGEVCEKALKVKRQEMPLSKEIKYLDIGGIDNHLNKIVSHKDYTWKDAPSRAQQIIKKGDILFSTVRTYLKNIAKVNKNDYNNEICSSGFTVLRAQKELLDEDYLFFLTLSTDFSNSLSKLQTGTSYPAVRDKDVFSQTIPLPPLPIQRAIVAKIEELFSSLDSGIADLKKAQEQLVIYRQAVLKKAFEGHKEVQFEKIISSTQNGISKRKGEKGDLIKVLRLADIKNLKIDNTNPRKIQLNKDEENKYKLNAGDLIVIRVNGSINLVGRFIHVSKKDEIELWAFCDHFIRITLDLTKCHPIFYYYFFQLSKVRKFINYNMVSSAGQNTVSQTTVKSISVPLISLKEQNQIIREIESRLSVCDKVEESIAESLEKAKALRQSILKKAFEGKLLSEEEIAKCKREKDYEPAYKLLERIKAEKKNKK